MSERVKLFKVLPAVYKAFLEVEQTIGKAIANKKTLELVKIRASQMNGCAFCLDMHIKDAIKEGEQQERINILAGWREAPKWFSAEEQAVLCLTEELTHLQSSGVKDSTYQSVIALLGEEQTAVFIAAISMINLWNRTAVATHLQP